MSANIKADQGLTSKEIDGLASRILSSRKYRDLDLPLETISDLIHQNLNNGRNFREVEKVVRQKLHNIIAPYLESVDYSAASAELQSISVFDKTAIEHFSLIMLENHASTRERLPIMREFYERIFSITGVPDLILDLACGFNPFALPWMNLPPNTTYRAYDLLQPRVDLINKYLPHVDRPPLAEKRDILVNPPKEKADVVFFFKEAHRFEQRQHGCNRAFWESLNVRYLLVSLPTANLTGSRTMVEGQRILVERTISGLPWKLSEILFDTEIVFCIDKGR